MKKKSGKFIQIAMLLFFVSMFIISCKKDDTSPAPAPTPPAASIVGIWHDVGTSVSGATTLKFNANNTYSLSGITIKLDTGTYIINSSTITLKSTSSLFCTVNEPCNYTFLVSATTLKFTYLNDGCLQRSQFFNLPFERP